MKRNYMFTDRKYSKRGIMSFVFGVLSLISIFLGIFLSYRNGGVAPIGYGVGIFLAAVFSIVGLILGLLTVYDTRYFRGFSIAGVIINLVALLGWMIILYAGLYM